MRFLVAGPPASGKSTLARELAARHGAEVIDFDDIARGLGSSSDHDHAPGVRSAANVELERRVDAVTGPVVVVRSVPRAGDRAALADRIGADEVVVLAVPADEAKRRAVAAGRPAWTADVIDRWWSAYEPSDRDGRGLTERGVSAMDDPTTPPAPEGGQQPAPADPPASAVSADPSQLGDAGKKALDEERRARRDLEKRLKEWEPLVKEAEAHKEAQKTEVQKLSEALNAAKAEASTATRSHLQLEVALDKAPAGMDLATVRSLAGRLQGASRKELETDAELLFATFAPPAASSEPGRSGPPVEQLRPGALPGQPETSLQDQIRAAEAAGDWKTSMALKAQMSAPGRQ